MKTLLCALLLTSFGTAAAKADPITIHFDHPPQSAAAGQTIAFSGTITNNTGDTLFFNSDSLNLNGLSFSVNDLFLSNVPISLSPGATSDDVEFFDISVSNPLVDAPGLFPGSYTLLGGADAGADTAQDNLGSAQFSVNTAPVSSSVPEPASIYLLLGGLATLAPLSRTSRR